jgi:hypothetical protein
MKFEHLIEINDPMNPLIDILTHEQVWRGLVLRAESPKLFVPHLDEVRIGERSERGFRRVQRYGDLVIEDTVVLEYPDRIRYEVAPQGEISRSSLTMTIESHGPGLFVRFEYEDAHNAREDEENKMYDDFRRSAYKESDIDTIRVLRDLAEQGRLDATLN